MIGPIGDDEEHLFARSAPLYDPTTCQLSGRSNAAGEVHETRPRRTMAAGCWRVSQSQRVTALLASSPVRISHRTNARTKRSLND